MGENEHGLQALRLRMRQPRTLLFATLRLALALSLCARAQQKSMTPRAAIELDSAPSAQEIKWQSADRKAHFGKEVAILSAHTLLRIACLNLLNSVYDPFARTCAYLQTS